MKNLKTMERPKGGSEHHASMMHRGVARPVVMGNGPVANCLISLEC